ncbi:uncharacterized protein LOC142322243 [Lycorma delicatula]|uniref:uncharacterized protein LOC142322243 n=1 Tax=Lycorma delicatula TaxID=130591 RepID=UPI003F50F28D
MSLVAAYSGSSDENDEDYTIVQSVANIAVIKKANHLSPTNDVKITENEKHNDIPVNSDNNSNVFNNVNGSDYNSKLSNGISADISDEEDDITDEKLNNNGLILSDSKEIENKTLFTLPAPKITKLHDIDFDWSRLSKGVKGITQPIKISVPSLADLDNDESTEPVKKKLKPSKKGSGLFALLPTPKNTLIDQTKTTLKPQQINKKVQERIKSQTKVENKFLNTKSILSKKKKLSVDYDDSPDDEDIDNNKVADFFSLSTSTNELTSAVQLSHVDFVSSSDKKEDALQTQPQSYQTAKASTSFISSETSTSNASSITTEKLSAEFTSYIPLDQEDIQLDETALQQLCGRRDRHKGGTNLQIIDVSGDAIMPDAREWLTKQLTEEKNTNIQSHKKKDGPTTQQRRKHQITYLAFQAKEHELELKNQWANNRMSRKQTQAKYGF